MNRQPVTNVIMKWLVKSYSFIDVWTIRNLEESISPNIFCGVNTALQCVKIAVILALRLELVLAYQTAGD